MNTKSREATRTNSRVRGKSLRKQAKRLSVESLETRNLLAVDMLANVPLDDGAVFRPQEIVGYRGDILFRGDDGFVGPEVWITNGDPADVSLLKDIRIGAGGSGPRDFTEYQGRLFFAASNGGNGYELWVTQGSKASTQLIGDIWPGPESGVPTDITVFNGLMYFFANDGESGRELYRSDGTPVGTFRIADSVPGRSGSSGEQMLVVGDKMFFTSDSADPTKLGLWVSDGTAEGTQHLPIPGVDVRNIKALIPFGDRLLFASGSDVFVTDGTVEGSSQLPAITSNDGGTPTSGGDVVNISVLNDRVYATHEFSSFTRAYAPGLQSVELIANADGTEVASGRLYHWSENGFYVLEPDNSSTRLMSFNSFFGTKVTNVSVVDNGLLVGVNRTLDRFEIWATNGTADGTSMIEQVTDTNPDPLLGFQQVGDSIYFTATNGNRRNSLWKVEAPTIEAVDPPLPPEPTALLGDVNADNTVNVQDVDAVFAAASSGSSDLGFDVDSDGAVAAKDGTFIVESVLNTKLGDFDLNGKIEFADFLVLSTNFGKAGTYAEGDADGDGMVAFSDFLLLSTEFGFERA